MFTYPICNFSASKLPTLEFLDNSISASNIQNHSFSGVNFGEESSDRLIVACLSGFRGASVTISSATIGGVSATANMTYSASLTQMYIISAVVPSGTLGVIDVVFNNTTNWVPLSVFSVKDYESTTPVITETLASSPLSASISRDKGTAVIAHAINYSYSGAITWGGTAGLTEYESQYGENIRHSSAMNLFESGGSDLTVTATSSGSSENRMQVIGFR